jgi:nitrogen regulatory protein PII
MLSEVTSALEAIQHLPSATGSNVQGFGRGQAVNAADKIVHREIT